MEQGVLATILSPKVLVPAGAAVAAGALYWFTAGGAGPRELGKLDARAREQLVTPESDAPAIERNGYVVDNLNALARFGEFHPEAWRGLVRSVFVFQCEELLVTEASAKSRLFGSFERYHRAATAIKKALLDLRTAVSRRFQGRTCVATDLFDDAQNRLDKYFQGQVQNLLQEADRRRRMYYSSMTIKQ
jgi:hypothetical protein